MKPEDLRIRIPEKDLVWSASKSSGPGGQNVNKVNTRVELRFNIKNSTTLSETEKELIRKKLKNRINSDFELIITSQSERSQLKNKEKVLDKFFKLLCIALTEDPERKATSPTLSSKQKRIEAKIQHSRIKKLRKTPDDPHNE